MKLLKLCHFTSCRYKGVFEHLASKGDVGDNVGLNAVVDGTVPIG